MVDDEMLYATLTTYTSGACGDRLLVTPFMPEESAFLLAQEGKCAYIPQMPLGCVDDCTPAADLEAVRQWIAAGAPNE
jgi:hypothetical protein